MLITTLGGLGLFLLGMIIMTGVLLVITYVPGISLLLPSLFMR